MIEPLSRATDEFAAEINELKRQAEHYRMEADALRRANEKLLRALEADRFKASVIESSDDAIITKDLNGTIDSWNNGAERLFGYKAAEVIGKPVSILIPADRQDEEPQILSRLRRGERIEHYETIRRRKDGKLVDISLTVSPVRGADGWVIGASKIARDITEQKAAQRELQHAREQLALANENLENRVAERT